MSIKGLQSLGRKATRGNENRRCAVLLGSNLNNVNSGSGKPWFKKAPVGVNKLNTLMKTVAQKAGLGPNFKNHRGRKTMIQTSINNDVPPTSDIMQLLGHKNVRSITSYSTVSQKQQLNMSHTLTGLSSGEIAAQSGREFSILAKRKHEFDELTYPTFRPTFSQQRKQAAQQPFSLFSSAVISGGHISVVINTLNQSPTLSLPERKTQAKPIKESNLLIRILTSVCQSKHAGSDKKKGMKSRVFTSVFKILNFQ